MSVLDPETREESEARLWKWAQEVAAELKTKDAPRYLVRRYGLLRAYLAELRCSGVANPLARRAFTMGDLLRMENDAMHDIDEMMRSIGHDSLSRPRAEAKPVVQGPLVLTHRSDATEKEDAKEDVEHK